MKKRLYLLTLLSFAALLAHAHTISAPVQLKWEYLSTPLGIDTPTPRFSWVVGDRNRQAVQSAFQILVSSGPEKLAAGVGDYCQVRTPLSNFLFVG